MKAPQKEDDNGKPNGSVVFHCHVSFSGEVVQTTRKLDLLRSICKEKKTISILGSLSMYVYKSGFPVSMIFCRPLLALPSYDEDKNRRAYYKLPRVFPKKNRSSFRRCAVLLS